MTNFTIILMFFNENFQHFDKIWTALGIFLKFLIEKFPKKGVPLFAGFQIFFLDFETPVFSKKQHLKCIFSLMSLKHDGNSLFHRNKHLWGSGWKKSLENKINRFQSRKFKKILEPLRKIFHFSSYFIY